MNFEPVEIILKDGRTAVLRTAQIADAAEMLAFRIKSLGQTDYLMQYPEEMADYTIEKQSNFINRMIESPNDKMFTVIVDGRIAGTGQVSFNSRIKTRHKAGIGIALLKEYWGLGIGSAIFTEIIKTAQGREGVELLELEVASCNTSAIRLYDKLGFVVYGQRPYSLKLKDGTYYDELLMVLDLK